MDPGVVLVDSNLLVLAQGLSHLVQRGYDIVCVETVLNDVSVDPAMLFRDEATDNDAWKIAES